MHSPKSPGGEIDPAAEGQFWVGGELRDLNPPVDWSEEPYAEGDEYAFFLNCFIFADTVLVTDASEDLFERILEVLAGIYLDWIEQNPQVDHPNAHKYAWYDHAAAARLVHLAYLLREAVRTGQLDGEQRHALAVSIVEHADYVLSDENYQPNHNHGLFSDAALKLAADALSVRTRGGALGRDGEPPVPKGCGAHRRHLGRGSPRALPLLPTGGPERACSIRAGRVCCQPRNSRRCSSAWTRQPPG